MIKLTQRRQYKLRLEMSKVTQLTFVRCEVGIGRATIVESEEVASGAVLKTNEAIQVVGVEMLFLLKRSTNFNLSTLEFVTA